jgi:hypothetical protein
VIKRRPSSLAVVFALVSSLVGCELIADFDQSKLDENRTIGPTPLPVTDGAVPLVPDGSTQLDGALLREDGGGPSPQSDAAVTDAGPPLGPVDDLDASVTDASADGAAQDAAAEDAALDAAPVDSAVDAAEPPEDASLELFADV